MDQIQNIKFLKNFKGMSLRKIAQETGHHFETVQKYAVQENFNLPAREKQTRKSKLDPFKEQINEWLLEDTLTWHKQRHTAQRIYDRLKEIHGIRKINGSVNNFVLLPFITESSQMGFDFFWKIDG